MFSEHYLFVSGSEGYHTFRIPALVVTNRGTILAFAEGRKHSRSDAGEIHLVLKRSTDGGRTWGDMQLVVRDSDMTCGNPCPVVDRCTGTIWLPSCKNLGDGPAPGALRRLLVLPDAPVQWELVPGHPRDLSG